MRASRFLKRLTNSLSQHKELVGRKSIAEKASALGKDVRAMVATTGLPDAPIVIWFSPDQTREERAEAISWALAHIALGHLNQPLTFTLIQGTLKLDALPDLRMSVRDLLEQAKTDRCLKAFIWGANLLSDEHRFRELLESGLSRKEARTILATEMGAPRRLIQLWEKCRSLPSEELEKVIGNPQEWARQILKSD